MIDCRMGRVKSPNPAHSCPDFLLCGVGPFGSEKIRVPAGGNGKKHMHLVSFQFLILFVPDIPTEVARSLFVENIYQRILTIGK